MRGLLKLIALFAAALWLADRVRDLVRPPRDRFDWRPSYAAQLYAKLCVWIDQRYGWDHLPPYLGLAVLLGERVRLRHKNLYDTSQDPTLPQPQPQARGVEFLSDRMPSGTFNDLQDPRMGSADTRFGRNVPIEFTWPDPDDRIMTPNPRVVSRELLTRDTFQPATSLNMLAAAWIQFMTRDWFSHGPGDISNPWTVPLPAGDDFPQNPMLIPRTIADPTRPPDDRSAPPTHVNLETAWWDGSQVYPVDQKLQGSVRTGTGGVTVRDRGRPVSRKVVSPRTTSRPAPSFFSAFLASSVPSASRPGIGGIRWLDRSISTEGRSDAA